MSLKSSKTNLIKELFVRSADQNYITARMCMFNDLHNDFLWLALHCLEKYMKAILLLNGHSSIKNSSGKVFGHDLQTLYDEIKNLCDVQLLPPTLTKPICFASDVIWIDKRAEEYLLHLNKNGNADNRYLIFGYATEINDLFMLDQMVFNLRRLTCRLDDKIIPNKNDAKTFKEILINQPKFYFDSGLPLDKIIKCKESSEVKHATLNMNFPFAPQDYNHTDVIGGFYAHNPVILRRIFDPLENKDRCVVYETITLAEWFIDNVKLPNNIKSEIKDKTLKAKKKM